ncbi:MAG: hypothetical protein ACRESJ_19875 [Pseudomonas sp.]|uniref:hypothetical protein n=1 Tax=Pseudomonas sp. TaxID=306 RepID=UPI003D6F6257
MEVTVPCGDYDGLAQPIRLAAVCRRMYRWNADDNRIPYEKTAIALSDLILVGDINGAQGQLSYLVGKNAQGRRA